MKLASNTLNHVQGHIEQNPKCSAPYFTSSETLLKCQDPLWVELYLFHRYSCIGAFQENGPKPLKSYSGRALARKLKLLTVFSKQGNQTSVYQRSPPFLATKIFFWQNPQNAGKPHPGKEIFQSMTLHSRHKSPLKNVFFFVYHKLDWDMEQK